MHHTELKDYLINYRKKLEVAWTAETASPKAPWHPNKPISTGQCSASSIILIKDLRKKFPDLKFKTAIGRVIDSASGKEEIEIHVWLMLYEDGQFKAPVIIDLTADQSDLIDEKMIFSSINGVAEEKHLNYLVYNLLEPEQHKDETIARAVLLSESMLGLI